MSRYTEGAACGWERHCAGLSKPHALSIYNVHGINSLEIGLLADQAKHGGVDFREMKRKAAELERTKRNSA